MNKPTMIVSSIALLVTLTTLGLVLNLSKRLEMQSASMQATLTGIATRTDKSLGGVISTLGTGLDSIGIKVDQQQATLTGIADRTDTSLGKVTNTLEIGLDAMGAKVDQQSMLVNRALGKVMPLILPSGPLKTIEDIESQLKDESKWPKALLDIQNLNERLASVVNSLPPWAQEELLPRIVPRRWEIDALWVCANSPDGSETNLLTHAKAVESLLSQKPPDSSEVLNDLLKAKQKEIDDQIAQAEKAAAFSKAKAALAGDGDAESATRLMGVYNDDAARDLVNQLQSLMLKNAFSNNLASARQELADYAAIPEGPLQDFAYSRAYQATLELRLRMRRSGLTDATLAVELDTLEKEVASKVDEINTNKQRREVEKMRQYQVWALGQLKQVRTYEAVKELEKNKIGSKLDRNNLLSAAYENAKKTASATLRDEMIRLMSTINQGVLDEAVSQLFRKVYQSRFDKLNEADQLSVIEAFAVADKRQME